MRKILAMAVVLVVASGMVALADPLKKGNKELNFSFSYDSFDPGGDADKAKTTMLDGAFGWLLTDSQEVGGLLNYTSTDLGGDSETTDAYGLGAFYHWNFKAGDSMNPYLGARLGFFGGDLSDFYDMFYGVEGGVKFYPWANAGMNFGLRWEKWTGAEDGIEDADNMSVFAGMLFKF